MKSRIFESHQIPKKELMEEEVSGIVYPETFISLQMEKASLIFFYWTLFNIGVDILFEMFNIKLSFAWLIQIIKTE